MKKLIIIILSFFIVFPLFAERIILKTGKEINKKITERTEESITVEVLGMPVTYKLSDIASIDDEVFAPVEKKVPVAKESPDITPQGYFELNDYLIKAQGLLRKFIESDGRHMDKVISTAATTDGNEKAKKMKQLAAKYAKIHRKRLKDIEALKPPDDCKSYHKKLVELHLNKINSLESYSKEDLESFSIYFRKSRNNEIEILEITLGIFKKHNAPREEIAELEAAIEALKSQ